MLDNLLVHASHRNGLMSLKICGLGCIFLSKPFGLEFGALFLESGQKRLDLSQELQLLLVFEVLVVRVALTSLHLLELVGFLLFCEGLKPVTVSGILIRRRWLVVDVLCNLVIFNT